MVPIGRREADNGRADMDVIIFVYTILLILCCFAAAMLSLAAYAVSHKRSLVPQVAFFVCYIVEVTGILGCEFTKQNLAYDASAYYEITLPVLRILTGVGILASLWIMLLDILDVHDRRVQVVPVVIFALACCVAVWGLPYGPLRQWLFYTLRQAFIAFGLGFAYLRWRRTTDMPYRGRLGRLRSRYLLLWLLLCCILVEDWWVILMAPVPDPTDNWITLYLSERNFSENAMMLFVAYQAIRSSLETLALRFNEPPVVRRDGGVGKLARHIADLLPAYAATHRLSPREREVLAMVIGGMDNRSIAQELFLSEGTVKTHVHNIMRKTGTRTRDELKKSFWAS